MTHSTTTRLKSSSGYAIYVPGYKLKLFVRYLFYRLGKFLSAYVLARRSCLLPFRKARKRIVYFFVQFRKFFRCFAP
nr:MAG TPA: hypothetical protein [Caudoviricetes sp.]